MDTASSLPTAMQSFIVGCSPAQRAQLIQALQDVQTVPITNASLNMSNRAGVATTRTGKKQRQKAMTTGGSKRPLNSWMAFRKYYNGSLAPHTQKTISKLLTSMWRADPFEVKWAMLAKAYSILRGNREKDEVPLDEFFNICAPMIGIIPPDQYLQVMGWQLGPARADDEEKLPQLTRIFVPNLNTLATMYNTHPYSVDDLVSHCRNVGYAAVTTDITPNITEDTNASESLTMAVQPTVMSTAGTSTEDILANEELLRMVLEEAPDSALGGTELANITATYDSPNAWMASFDPTREVEVTFNPNATQDGDAWDAMPELDLSNPDFDLATYINTDHLA